MHPTFRPTSRATLRPTLRPRTAAPTHPARPATLAVAVGRPAVGPAAALALLLAGCALFLAAAAGAAPPDAVRIEGEGFSIEFVGDPAAFRRQRLERWLPVYRREMPPIEAALRRLSEALTVAPSGITESECRDLGRAVAALDREELLPAPDFALNRHLTAAIFHLARGATACLSHHTSFPVEIGRARRDLAHARQALGRLGPEL